MGNKNSGRRTIPVECAKYLKAQGKKSLDVVVKIRDDEDNPSSTRLEAARYILDQLWGKAPVRVDVGGAEGGPVEILLRIVDETHQQEQADSNSNTDP